MSLDLSQNIIIWLTLVITIVALIMLFRFSKISNTQKKILRTLKRLKFEVDKIQRMESHLAETLTDKQTFKSWLEEDEERLRKRLEYREKKKKRRAIKFNNFKVKFLDNIDNFAGIKVIDKVGIASFLAALALFINLSMEMDWINSFGRLFIGLSMTIILLVTGYLIRKKFEHFSNILMGGGIAAFIFSIFAGYYQYHIISLSLWYIFTVFVILVTILLAVSFKRHEIALITFVAAYLAPFTVNFISSDYIVLFSYLTLLNIGVLIYDKYQKSLVINLLSFGLTFIIYGIWLINLIYFKKAEVPYLGAFLFLTIFYILFLIIVIINNISTGKLFEKIEFSIMMTAKAVYLSVGMIIITEAGVPYQGLFMGLIAIINYVFFLILYPKKNFDRRILNSFLALSIMFFALIIPVEFYGKTITMVWALQSFVLMFIAVRSKLDSMRTSSLFLTLGMIVSLYIDLIDEYLGTTGEITYIKPFLNEGFLTSLLVLASILTVIFLLKDIKGEYFIGKFLKVKIYRAFLAVIFIVTIYFSFFLEIKYWAIQHFTSADAVATTVAVFNTAFLGLASLPVWFLKNKGTAWAAIGMATLTGLLFILYYAPIFTQLRNEYLLGIEVTKAEYSIHYWVFGILMIIIASAIRGLKFVSDSEKLIHYVFALIISTIFIYVVSNEASLFYTVKLYKPHLLIHSIADHIHRFTYTVIWSIAGFILLLAGILQNIRSIKTIAILLYFIIPFKIFLYDFFKIDSRLLMYALGIYGLVLILSSFLFHLNTVLNENKIVQKI